MPLIPGQSLTARLRLPQIRVLEVLSTGSPPPTLTRSKMASKAGISPQSATIWRVLNGVGEGSSTGSARPGLLELKMVAAIELDIDGLKEVAYRITNLGRAAYTEWVSKHGQLPPLRSKEASTNRRYNGATNGDEEEDNNVEA